MIRPVNKLIDEALLKLGAKYKSMCLLNAVFSPGSKMEIFAKNYEDRYFSQGLSVENALAAAAGITLRGKLPFVVADAAFLIGSGYKQLRDMIAHPNLNVKLVGLSAGITLGRQGFGYQAVDDLSLTLPLPNMKVFAPADIAEFKSALAEAAQIFGPVYIRASFNKDVDISGKRNRFSEGGAEIIHRGNDITVFSYGAMLEPLLKIAKNLKKEDISMMVVNVFSLKPLHEKMLVKCASESKFSVVVEDHFVGGGLGNVLAGLFAEKYPTRLFVLGFNDFTDSNKSELIYKKFNLDFEGLTKKLKSLIKLV